jgi:PAS domain S-box-containing protein
VILDETSDASGVLVGRTVLTANPVLTPVVEILESGFVGSGVGFVMDEQNRILLHPAQPESQQQHFSMNPISEIAPPLREGRAFHQREADGTRDLIYVLPIVGRSDWSIVVTMPNEVVLALAAQIAVPMLVLLLGLTAVAVPLIITVTHRITGPLEQLLIGVDALSKGDLTHPVQVSGEDEIGRLGQAFEQMQIRLKDRLDEQERLLRVSRSVSSSLELFRAMPPILSSALEVSNAAGVRMVIRRSGSPPESYSAGEAAAVIAPLDTHLMEMVERQGTLVISQLWRASHTLDTAALPSNIQALMALPLRSDTSFHGILWLAYDHEHVFEQPEMTFLSTLASQAAVGIANAKLFAEAQEERRKLEGVLESTADAMIVADQQGRIALLNPAAEQYLGARADLVRGKRAQEVIEVEALASLLTDLQEPVSVLELPGQRGKVLLANVSTIFSHEGTISGRVAVMRDITALKELDNIKTVFLRMVSHDLRSPLTYMRGYLSMLPLAGDLNDRQEEAIEKVNSGINSISDLTERLLYLSRLQFGEEAELEVSLIDITDLVHEVVMQQEDVTRDRDVAVRLEMQEKLPLLAADAMLYRQAVANLISNALKYTPDGGQIVIRAFQVSENGHAQITVSVEDTGIGIREEDQSRLFEAFFRVPQREGDPVRPRGTGLGLALVKAIATAHGGTVGVQSRFGQGSVFHITLPVRLPEDL